MEKELPEIKKNISLSKLTSFKIGGRAKYFFIAETKEDLIRAVRAAKKLKTPFFILGGGSNLLVSDKGYKGLVINFQFSIFNFQKDKIITGAGTKLSELVVASAKRGLSGLEWAAGIPGTVGGAIHGNAGAFGKSMADVVKEAAVLDIREKAQSEKRKAQNHNLKLKTLKNKDCGFGHRESIFKKKKNLIILSAELQLKKGKKKEIESRVEECLEYKKKTQPLNYPSAGSIFKNPSGYFAGELIEKCGLKGRKIGEAKISEKHANFIVNSGRAKAKDVKKLIELIKKKVKNKFKVTLKEEIEII